MFSTSNIGRLLEGLDKAIHLKYRVVLSKIARCSCRYVGVVDVLVEIWSVAEILLSCCQW
jgi:hypothetical protein